MECYCLSITSNLSVIPSLLKRMCVRVLSYGICPPTVLLKLRIKCKFGLLWAENPSGVGSGLSFLFLLILSAWHTWTHMDTPVHGPLHTQLGGFARKDTLVLFWVKYGCRRRVDSPAVSSGLACIFSFYCTCAGPSISACV